MFIRNEFMQCSAVQIVYIQQIIINIEFLHFKIQGFNTFNPHNNSQRFIIIHIF